MISEFSNPENSGGTSQPGDSPKPSGNGKRELFSSVLDELTTPTEHATPAPGELDDLMLGNIGYIEELADSHPIERKAGADLTGPEDRTPGQILPPKRPSTLAECGLTMGQMCEHVLKLIYLQGSIVGVEFSQHLKVPFSVIDETLQFLTNEKCIEVTSGDVMGRVSYRFQLTDLGRTRAREAFEQCKYVGPIPVPLDEYVRQCRMQTVIGMPCHPETLEEAFRDLIMKPELMNEIGPAVCSGKSIFIYGPPGNGKTMVAKGLGKFLNTNGGEIYIPYAIQTANSIITMFDPTLHQATDQPTRTSSLSNPMTLTATEAISKLEKDEVDLRWRKIRRPVIITGGELTLEMLELRYDSVGKYYQAPLHIKANGGVFLIDDFGRQLVSPRELLNRWIIPLEEKIDFMTPATGKKFAVPFEQMIIFSTNLDPRELVDEAFLRRIRHKISIGPPDRDHYTAIFKLCCNARGIEYQETAVDFLYAKYYDGGKLPRSSDPRDLLEIVQSICRFNRKPLVLTQEVIAEAAEKFFCVVQ